MSHDLCLYSRFEEFDLVGNPDAEGFGLGRAKVFGGNADSVVTWYAEHCKDLAWDQETWLGLANLSPSSLYENNCYTSPPEWADPDPVARHLAMVDAFLAFAPDAKFGAS
jgi:hypothetical protein